MGSYSQCSWGIRWSWSQLCEGPSWDLHLQDVAFQVKQVLINAFTVPTSMVYTIHVVGSKRYHREQIRLHPLLNSWWFSDESWDSSPWKAAGESGKVDFTYMCPPCTISMRSSALFQVCKHVGICPASRGIAMCRSCLPVLTISGMRLVLRLTSSSTEDKCHVSPCSFNPSGQQQSA
jgi:Zn-finger nucleic acid-binding protein